MDGRQGPYNGRQDDDSFRLPGIAHICILFSITIALFLLIGYRVQYREFYSGILITEFGLILLPALIYLFILRLNFKNVLRLKKTRFLNFFLVFWIMTFAIPFSGVFNFINLWLVNSIFGKVIIKQVPAANNLTGLVLNILVIGGTAGICEEILFRGVIQRGMERFGNGRAILIAAFLFSLMHLDFQKIFGTFLLGALIGYIVYRSNTLFCGMFAHFANNSLAVLISYVLTKLTALVEGAGMKIPEETDLSGFFSSLGSLSGEQLVMVLFFYGFMLLIFITIFILLLFAFLKINPAERKNLPYKKRAIMQRSEIRKQRSDVQYNREAIVQRPDIRNQKPDVPYKADEAVLFNNETQGKGGFLWLIPGILSVMAVYFTEVMAFNGVSNVFTEQLRRLLGI